MIEWIIGGVVAIIGAFVVGVVKGGSRQREKQQKEEHNRYVATGKRIDQAVRDSDGDDSAWLRERSKR